MKGLLHNLLWVLGACLAILFKGVLCVYFTQTENLFCAEFRLGVVVGQIQAQPNSSDKCNVTAIQYRLQTGDDSGPHSVDFAINSTGWIYIEKISSAGNINSDVFHLNVQAGCKLDNDFKVASVTVNDISQCYCGNEAYNSDVIHDDVMSKFCFQREEFNFYIEENISPLKLGNLGVCSVGNYGNNVKRIYNIQDTRSDIARKFSIDSESSSFKLIQYFDREEYDFIGFKVNCTISKDNKVIWSKTANIKLSIGDVNDNPILIMRNLHSFINRVDKDLGPGENVSTFVLIDKDLYNCSSHRVTHLTDPHRVCRDATISQFNYWGKYDNKHVICKLAVTVSREQIMDGNFYMCKLGIKDPEYKPFGNTNFTDTTIIRINISNVKPPTITPPTFHIASLHRGAAKFTRILSLSSLGFKAYFMTKPKAFQITRETGILYVDDPTMLKGKEQNVSVVAVKNNQGPGSNMETIVVRVNLLSPERDSNRTCENSCSMASTMDGCKSGCGYGVETGHCIWRSSADVTTATWSKAYQTCTYNPHLCPNGICDELERAEPNLCPQDCTETVVGPGILNSNVFPPRGIIMAAGPCWCSYNARCTCFDSTSTIRTTHRPDLRLNKTNEQQRQIDEGDEGYSEMTLNVTTGQLHSNHLSQAGDAGPCDENCKTTIAATVGCLGAAVCLFILGWRLRKLRCHNGQNLKKYVGSLVSVSAVPSDYHDDREMYRNTFVDPQWNIKGPMAYSPTPEDTKWEFERDNLILDQTLGEGEFGRVVKAKFYQMDSKDGYKEVAVKMLKNCASTAELHDLLSEFNLLKDVNHPNVIKLLGACTQNGPFYVIVEYCEHGSLLHYLRRSRLEENGYVNNRFRHRELYNGEHLEPELLTVGDLLSFAWQIGKGMKYLSEIKLVHRDLAARNVLVATGKILKISDFGLTRDVYEADTYLKQSKGRIPVKWLAPESLYAQIYTTLSDVWSYGIVLWEIVTLGAPPYPGIPPERLYNLLIAGYRMDRPESCTDELYAVMQKCWKSDPSERPTFSQLTEIFDRLLQQRTEYLDLTGGAIEQRPDMYDRCFEKSSTDKFFDNLTAEPEEQRTPTDKYGSISVISGNMESYLTPSSVDRTEPDDRVFFGNKVMFDNTEERDVNKLSFKKCLEPKDTIRMDENLSLLPDTGTALFSPSMSEVDEDWDPHETDVLSVQVH